MRSPVMIRKKDHLPLYYPVFEDLATPLGLVKALEPESRIVRLVAKAQISKGDENKFAGKMLDGYGRFEVGSVRGVKGCLVVDCLDKSQQHIEQVFRAKDITNDVLNNTFPEMVMKHVDYLRPAANDCDICNTNGIESLIISEENSDPGRAWSANGRSASHSQYLIDRMVENDRLGIYPISNINRYVKSAMKVVAMKGCDGEKLISTKDFLPEPYAQKAVGKLMAPWTKERWWTSVREPAIKCVPAYQSDLSQDFRGRVVG